MTNQPKDANVLNTCLGTQVHYEIRKHVEDITYELVLPVFYSLEKAISAYQSIIQEDEVGYFALVGVTSDHVVMETLSRLEDWERDDV